VARLYAHEGFAVALDDVVFARDVRSMYEPHLGGLPLVRVLLLPSVDVALARNAARTSKAFDTSVLAEPIRHIRDALAAQGDQLAGWLILDTSALTADETVDQILAWPSAGAPPR
jgi:hypothetical protein